MVLAGLTGDSWNALIRFYAAGAGGWFDAVAVHPYAGTPRLMLRTLRAMRAVMAANGDAALPLWVTEFSWPAALGQPGVKFGVEVSARQQAESLAGAMRILYRAHRRLKLGRVLWYTWLSSEPDPARGTGPACAASAPVGTVSTPALRTFRIAAGDCAGAPDARSAARCG